MWGSSLKVSVLFWLKVSTFSAAVESRKGNDPYNCLPLNSLCGSGSCFQHLPTSSLEEHADVLFVCLRQGLAAQPSLAVNPFSPLGFPSARVVGCVPLPHPDALLCWQRQPGCHCFPHFAVSALTMGSETVGCVRGGGIVEKLAPEKDSWIHHNQKLIQNQTGNKPKVSVAALLTMHSVTSL